MSKKKNILDLIATNPNVDGKQVERVREVIRELRKEGVQEARYNLLSPFARQPIKPTDEETAVDEDPRMVHLRR